MNSGFPAQYLEISTKIITERESEESLSFCYQKGLTYSCVYPQLSLPSATHTRVHVLHKLVCLGHNIFFLTFLPS